MRVLMISPPGGGIDVYVQNLVLGLRSLGVKTDMAGTKLPDQPYNPRANTWKTSGEVKKGVKSLTSKISFENYDLVAFHFGKNDLEQYIPVVLKGKGVRLKRSVYFVHFLSRNLFSQYLKDPWAQEQVENCVGSFFDGYIFFGTFAKRFMEKKYRKGLPGIVNFLPETHSRVRVPDEERFLKSRLFPETDLQKPTVFLPGSAANYKDHELLLSSFRYIERPINFGFAGLGWRKRIGFNRKRLGNVEVFVVDKYLSPQEFKILCKKSLFGVFPYRQPKVEGEYFQGSGVLPNFIHWGKACIVLAEGSMPEYIGEGGIAVRSPSSGNVARAINVLLTPEIRIKYERKAKARTHLFSPELHAQKCLMFFESLI